MKTYKIGQRVYWRDPGKTCAGWRTITQIYPENPDIIELDDGTGVYTWEIFRAQFKRKKEK